MATSVMWYSRTRSAISCRVKEANSVVTYRVDVRWRAISFDLPFVSLWIGWPWQSLFCQAKQMAVQQRIEYKICVLVYKCLHQAALNCVFRLLHLPAGVICVLQWKNASSSVTAGLRNMDSEASHTLAQLYGTHCHWQFATRRCHCCSSVHD